MKEKVVIQNEEDVVRWARETVDRNGEKFTALTKSDQYAIAQYILKQGDNSVNTSGCNRLLDGQAEQKELPVQTHSLIRGVTDPIEPQQTPAEIKEDSRCVPMTRAKAFHGSGVSAQQAFDRFLEWAKDHPQEAMVMDFSNGKQSAAAAFAYWLADVVAVEVPASERV